MAEYCGWAGKILNVDLGGKIEKEPLDPGFARKYLGASGFNSIRLFELVGPDIDALDPANVLILGAGPLTGTLYPGAARLTVTARSPATDIFGDSNMGGFFATELKFAGYDQIVVRGKADRPSYLWINDDEVEVRDASRLWGKSTWDTARLIREETGYPDVQVVCIGPAGENLVRIANIISPQKRACGRCGMGAVMGSKNLKAIAVRGSRSIRIAQPEKFLEICREAREYLVNVYPNYKHYHELGTPGLVDKIVPRGAVGVRNYQANLFPNWEAISGARIKREFTTSMMACPTCPLSCAIFHRVAAGDYAGVQGAGPEFALTGAAVKWGIDDLPALLKMNELFNQYGVDIHGARGIIAWAMECYERGILTEKDFDGTPLSFGNAKAVIEIIPKIARREGFGRIIAEGDKRADQFIGRGSEKYHYHIKGYSFVPEDPRANKLVGLAGLTSTRAADHLKSGTTQMASFLRQSEVGKLCLAGIVDANDPVGKGTTIKWFENAAAIHHASGTCIRTGASLRILTQAISFATGINFSEAEILEIGERIFNVQKAFNSRLGLTRADDNFSVPEKFVQEAVQEGQSQGQIFEREIMLDEYYQARGWDKATGLQTQKKLNDLGLEQIARELSQNQQVV